MKDKYIATCHIVPHSFFYNMEERQRKEKKVVISKRLPLMSYYHATHNFNFILCMVLYRSLLVGDRLLCSYS